MIDCIYIALPNHLHHELTIKALSKRKAVICEKPVALTTSDAVSMICTSEQNASPLHAAYMYRHHPQHHVVLDELTKGSIGEPKKLIANFCYERPEKGNIRLNKAAGGGALNDAGCYLLHLSLSIFDKAPSELSASQVLDAETGVDEETKILLQYPNGQSVELKCSLSSKRQNNYKIIGTEGEISLDTAFIVPRNKQNEVLVKSISGRERRISVPPANQFKLMLDSIGQSLMEKTANPNLKQDVLAVANLLDATRVSALDNRVVAIEFS